MRKRPQNCNKAYHVTIEGGSSTSTVAAMPPQFVTTSASPIMPPQPSTTLTPEMIQQMQQMTHLAFSAIGMSGKISNQSMWYLDLGASNHMTHSIDHFSHVKKYDGDLTIHIANAASLLVRAVGDIPHSPPLKHILYSSDLATNLLSVGQVAENNCKISFFVLWLFCTGSGIGKGDSEGA